MLAALQIENSRGGRCVMAANAMPVSSRQLQIDNPLRPWGGTLVLLGLVLLVEVTAATLWHTPDLEPSQARPAGMVLVVVAVVAGLALIFVGIRAIVLFVVPADAPAPIGGALEVLPTLLGPHTIADTYQHPSLLQALLHGLWPRFTHLTRPSRLLLDGLAFRLWLAPLPALLFLLPLQPQTPWLIAAWLGVLGFALVIHLAAVLLSGVEVPRCDVADRSGRSTTAGNPVDLFHHLVTVVGELREGRFPSRTWKEQPPSVGARAVNNQFDAELLIETQPLPLTGRGGAAALLLDVGGLLLGAVGCGMLLWLTALPDRQEAVVAVGGGLTALVLAWRFLTHAHRLHGSFRFRSDLFWVQFRGSYGVSEVGLGNGDGGRFFSRTTRIQSDLHWTVHATRVVSESSPPEWWSRYRRRRRARQRGEVFVEGTPLDRTALGSPRVVVEACDNDPDFLDRLDRLLKELREYRDPGGRLVGLDLTDDGVRQLVEANLRLTQLHHQATLPAMREEQPLLVQPETHSLAVPPAKPVPAAVDALLRELWRECLSEEGPTDARSRLDGLARLYDLDAGHIAAVGEQVRAERDSPPQCAGESL
jgi:hypothetical protein